MVRGDQLLVLDDFPEEMPTGVWDLVICLEALPRLDLEALLRATHWLSRQLTAGASVLAVSRNPDAHRLLIHRLACWHVYGELSEGVRIDRFDGDRAGRCDQERLWVQERDWGGEGQPRTAVVGMPLADDPQLARLRALRTSASLARSAASASSGM